jgi:hypothetical protein
VSLTDTTEFDEEKKTKSENLRGLSFKGICNVIKWEEFCQKAAITQRSANRHVPGVRYYYSISITNN